jgi:hypothetical protein
LKRCVRALPPIVSNLREVSKIYPGLVLPVLLYGLMWNV